MAEDSSLLEDIASPISINRKILNHPLPLPFVKTDLTQADNDAPVIVWFGHSSYLIRINGFNILVDPVFSNHAVTGFLYGESLSRRRCLQCSRYARY